MDTKATACALIMQQLVDRYLFELFDFNTTFSGRYSVTGRSCAIHTHGNRSDSLCSHCGKAGRSTSTLACTATDLSRDRAHSYVPEIVKVGQSLPFAPKWTFHAMLLMLSRSELLAPEQEFPVPNAPFSTKYGQYCASSVVHVPVIRVLARRYSRYSQIRRTAL